MVMHPLVLSASSWHGRCVSTTQWRGGALSAVTDRVVGQAQASQPWFCMRAAAIQLPRRILGQWEGCVVLYAFRQRAAAPHPPPSRSVGHVQYNQQQHSLSAHLGAVAAAAAEAAGALQGISSSCSVRPGCWGCCRECCPSHPGYDDSSSF